MMLEATHGLAIRQLRLRWPSHEGNGNAKYSNETALIVEGILSTALANIAVGLINKQSAIQIAATTSLKTGIMLCMHS